MRYRGNRSMVNYKEVTEKKNEEIHEIKGRKKKRALKSQKVKG